MFKFALTAVIPELFASGILEREGIKKIKKREWKYGAGADLLKRRGRGLALMLFDFFRVIIFTFWNYFTLCKIVLYIWRKFIFFCQHNFIKKSHSKLSKNDPVCMCKESWCVGLGQEGGSLREGGWVGGGIVWSTFKGGVIEKRTVETKILKREG